MVYAVCGGPLFFYVMKSQICERESAAGSYKREKRKEPKEKREYKKYSNT